MYNQHNMQWQVDECMIGWVQRHKTDHALSTEMTSDITLIEVACAFASAVSDMHKKIKNKKNRLPNPARNTGVLARVYVLCINADNYSDDVCV